jgi:chromosome segregation ATPase
MLSLRNSALTAALLLLPVLARAQDNGEAPKADAEKATPKPDGTQGKEDPTFESLRGSLQDLEKKEQKDAEEKRKQTIRRNQEETLKIYERALNNQTTELGNITRRLQVNQGIEQKYRKKLDETREELAKLQSRYLGRTLALKKSLDEGRISKDTYTRLLEEDGEKFRNREAELKEDLQFYEQEIETARKLIRELTLRKELLQIDPFEPEKAGENENNPAVLADRVRSRIDAIAGFREMSVIDALK